MCVRKREGNERGERVGVRGEIEWGRERENRGERKRGEGRVGVREQRQWGREREEGQSVGMREETEWVRERVWE